jgi:hypothetical protein
VRIGCKEKEMNYFEVSPPYVVFHDDQPGNHATLFVDGCKLLFVAEASSFDDRSKRYAWAFRGTVPTGAVLVFATADREVVCALGGVAEQKTWGSFVVRHEGKPVAVVGVRQVTLPSGKLVRTLVRFE